MSVVPLWRVRAAAEVLRGRNSHVAFGRPCPAGRRPPADADHAPFGDLLRRYVDGDGLVAYAAWRSTPADRDRLDDYLTALGALDPAAASHAGRVAFWVNAYNALMIAGVLRDKSGRCLCRQRNRLLRFNPWRDLRLWAGPGLRSLDEIEHRELRPLGEPRVHFALVCGARGCPPLRADAYTAAGLDAHLADNARRFFARPDAFHADPATRTLRLSPLLKWHGRDFGRTPAERVRAWRPYLPATESLGWLDVGKVRLAYTRYDWSLNERRAGCAGCEK